jgi:hypothetical protein
MTSTLLASFTNVGTQVSGISECVRQPQSMYAWVPTVLKGGFADKFLPMRETPIEKVITIK